ncbi:MAG TPA: hypothetical protein VNT50_02365 [Microbacterium sp.]|uniref:hypothetical protein n=1 Tax=Microbacterium sp. TaxID=51671 RepID=UPI002BEA515C|nr:hypothetical protein [Microbacterium sp.]HWI30311.1 hypothetical protein [Microbacterium sp.]
MSFRSFGIPGAARLVVLVGVGAAVAIDPLPAVTLSRDIRVVALGLDVREIEDPGAYGGETPAELTAQKVATLIRAELDHPQATAGLVAYRGGGDVALRAAAVLGETIDRLALVAVPRPETAFDREELARVLASIPAETLIVNGQRDEAAAAEDAEWCEEGIPASRVEMVPGDGPLALPDVWDRVLTHVAPGTKRR